MDTRNKDNAPYYRFTGPKRLAKIMHTCEGLLTGLVADHQITDAELPAFKEWLSECGEFSEQHPFRELVAAVHHIMAKRIVDAETRADLLWMCARFTTENYAYDAITADMQRLQGLLAGVVADNLITATELQSLAAWLEGHEDLRGHWPYDEVDALIVSVLADGRVSEAEHAKLVSFFSEFAEFGEHHALSSDAASSGTTLRGVCAVCPNIVFSGRRFCFTGTSKRAARTAIAQLVTKRGGVFSDSLNKQTDYLVIGANGSACWAYACYGRKVENAVRMRREGSQLLLIHENDFWDAVG